MGSQARGNHGSLERILVRGMSCRTAHQLASKAHADSRLLGALRRIALTGVPPASEKAAWVVGLCVSVFPETARGRVSGWIRDLDHPMPDNVLREWLRALLSVRLTPIQQGRILPRCMELLSEHGRDISVHYNALRHLHAIGNDHPELRAELGELVRRQLHHSSTGIRQLSRKILRNWGTAE